MQVYTMQEVEDEAQTSIAVKRRGFYGLGLESFVGRLVPQSFVGQPARTTTDRSSDHPPFELTLLRGGNCCAQKERSNSMTKKELFEHTRRKKMQIPTSVVATPTRVVVVAYQ